MIYYRARYLDPQLGRFVSRDPMGAWHDAESVGNAFTHAGANPFNRVDPLGLDADYPVAAVELLESIVRGVTKEMTQRALSALKLAYERGELSFSDYGHLRAGMEHCKRRLGDESYLGEALGPHFGLGLETDAPRGIYHPLGMVFINIFPRHISVLLNAQAELARGDVAKAEAALRKIAFTYSILLVHEFFHSFHDSLTEGEDEPSCYNPTYFQDETRAFWGANWYLHLLTASEDPGTRAGRAADASTAGWTQFESGKRSFDQFADATRDELKKRYSSNFDDEGRELPYRGAGDMIPAWDWREHWVQ